MEKTRKNKLAFVNSEEDIAAAAADADKKIFRLRLARRVVFSFSLFVLIALLLVQVSKMSNFF